MMCRAAGVVFRRFRCPEHQVETGYPAEVIDVCGAFSPISDAGIALNSADRWAAQ